MPRPFSAFARSSPFAMAGVIVGPSDSRQTLIATILPLAALRCGALGDIFSGRCRIERPSMSFLLLVAALLSQEDTFEALGETEGWQIARSGTGCLMVREFGGSGNTILTLSVDPALADTPLRMILGNSAWAIRQSDESGYAILFKGSGATWPDLVARTFASENEDGSVDGVISVGFTQNAMTPVLEDMAAASGLRLSRKEATISDLTFSGAEAAIQSLGRCVAALP
jgi:hypothetical protein